MNKECIYKIKSHISHCGFGDILFFTESKNYVYAVHYFFSGTNELWLNICKKDASYSYSVYLEKLFYTPNSKIIYELCNCNTLGSDCKICYNEIYKHISTNKKFKTIQLLG